MQTLNGDPLRSFGVNWSSRSVTTCVVLCQWLTKVPDGSGSRSLTARQDLIAVFDIADAQVDKVAPTQLAVD